METPTGHRDAGDIYGISMTETSAYHFQQIRTTSRKTLALRVRPGNEPVAATSIRSKRNPHVPLIYRN